MIILTIKELQFHSGVLFFQYQNMIVATSPDRFKNYADEEIDKIITLKKKGLKDKEIAVIVNRSYWSIVYKLQELRKMGLLKE
jgi:hypothetical protein